MRMQQAPTHLRPSPGWTCASWGWLAVLAGWACVFGPLWAHAATLPVGFEETQLASGLNPTAMALAPDGRLFFSDKSGKVRIIKNDVLLATPFVTLTVNDYNERGLVGIAFDPNFSVNQFVYVYYCATTPTIHNRVSRFTANGDVAVTGSELVLLDLGNLDAVGVHNGGALHFGKDGKLYISVGDNYNGANAQSLLNMFGKLLRINPDGSIPTDNPWYGTATGANRSIWCLGLRNPFTFAVQPGTGRIFINDVGDNAGSWEEINDGLAGFNYGWPNVIGNGGGMYKNPFYTYQHTTNKADGSATTGGSFYNPLVEQFPSTYVGRYFCADFTGGWIRTIDLSTKAATNFASGIDHPIDLKVAPDGSLYYLARGVGFDFRDRDGNTGSNTGSIWRVRYTGNQAPSIGAQPVNRTVPLGGTATFTVSASGTAPLTYQWQKNSLNIAGATAASYTTPPAVLADNGAAFRCVVTNAYGSATSNAALLTVTTNTRPSAFIDAPATGAKYNAGGVLAFSGHGTDPEDGTLPASACTWQIDFHHDSHTHPAMPGTTGITSGSFSIPNVGETAVEVWYRVYLTVVDGGGLSNTTYVDVLPNTALLNLATTPPGLQVTLDGQPLATPAAVGSVVGMSRTLGVVSPQILGTTTYVFSAWSDGKPATHSLFTPAADSTYTAAYVPATTYAKINFQLASTPIPAGYLPDYGNAYGVRGNGFTYGWNVDNSANARDRDNPNSPDQRYDTLVHMNKGGTYTWELAVPNGKYAVRVVEGDPSAFDVAANLSVEGIIAISGNTSSVQPWLEGNVTVAVNDGRLTLTTGMSSYNKLCFIDISALGAPNLPPTVATSANATPNPVTGTTTDLSVLGADDGGEPNLAYTWAASGPAPVAFSANGTNAAKNSRATFVAAGSYSLQATLKDGGGLTAISSVAVTVNQTLTSIAVSPASAAVPVNGTQQFTATVRDQFGNALVPQPACAWTVSGGGAITNAGLFTAGSAAGGPHTVTASNGGKSGTSSVTVTATPIFSAKLNFQLANAPIPAGYLPDYGNAYGNRGNGYTYGWNLDNTANARDRNAPSSPDQRYDTLVHMNKLGTFTWELAVPNGSYAVHVVEGDPSAFDVIANLSVEGVLAVSGNTSSTKPWLEGTVTVAVNDGRLTLTTGAASYNKICFLEVAAAGTPNQPPVIVSAPWANPSPVILPGTATVNVMSNDPDNGPAALTYTWSMVSGPGSASFLPNGTTASDAATASFSAAGNYMLRVTIFDGAASVSADVAITVNPPPVSGLLAYWKLDETLGTLASDSSPNGNTGTLVGGAAWASGKIGGALNFDGANDYVEAPHRSSLNVSDLTLAAWVYVRSTGEGSILDKRGAGGSGGYQIRVQGSTFPLDLDFMVKDPVTNETQLIALGKIPQNTWVHVAGVFDNAANSMQVYVNGALAGTRTGVTADPSVNSNTVPLRLGEISAWNVTMPSAFNLDGRLDEVRIYNRALSAAEIAALAQ